MKNTFFFLALIASYICSAQINYHDFNKRQESSCIKVDSLSVTNDFLLLDSLAQFDIVEGEEFYLYDRSMNYYYQNMLWDDEEALIKSIEYSKQCWEKYQNNNALWNLSFNLVWVNEYRKGIEYLDLYVRTRKKNKEPIDYEQVYLLYKKAYALSIAELP